MGNSPYVLELTDINNSVMADLLMKHCEVIKYCPQLKKWLEFTGIRWEPRDAEQIFKYVQGLQDTIKDSTPGSDGKLLMALSKMYNTGPLMQTLKNAGGIAPVSIEEFDVDPYILNCPNGILDLKTVQLESHDPSQLLTKMTGAAYIGKYHSSLWLDTVASIFPNEKTRNYVQKVLGYAISGVVDPAKFFILYGKGGNGKGVIMETVAKALGDYYVSIPSELLLSRKYSSETGNNATAGIMALQGARCARASETDADKALNINKVKQLTGGDLIPGRPPYGKELVNIKPTHKMFMETNNLPELPRTIENDIVRRIVVIPFSVTFSGANGNLKIGLKEELSRPENLEDVLTWLVEGWKMFTEEKGPEKLSMPPEVKTATNNYIRSYDAWGNFINHYCKFDPAESVDRGTLYNEYAVSCENDLAVQPVTKQKFYALIRDMGIKERKSNGQWLFVGIGLTKETPQPGPKAK